MRKLIAIVFLISNLSYAQNHVYKFDYEEFNQIKNAHFSNAAQLADYLPANYDKTGKTDYSIQIQRAIDENDKLIFPNFPLLIAPRAIKLKSNSKILFQEKSKLIIQANDKTGYWGVLIENSENVELYFLNIQGDRLVHKGKDGQWGQGLIIRSCKDILISHPLITECWGDGIYIGGKDLPVNDNITVCNAFIDSNRRNGISITSGKNIFVKDSYIANTKGQNPQSGIDIEPNINGDEIYNINLINITTFNNVKHGIVISTGNLAGEELKKIKVAVSNHVDHNSGVGLGISVTRANQPAGVIPLQGQIKIENSAYHNNKTAAIRNYKGQANKVILEIDNLSVSNGKENFSSGLNAKKQKLIENFKKNQKFDIR